jgi:hypothetical protein
MTTDSGPGDLEGEADDTPIPPIWDWQAAIEAYIDSQPAVSE